MKTAVVYYSMSGNTRQTAEKIRSAVGADSLAAQLILFDPKEKPSDEKEAAIKTFCDKLK